MKITSLRPSQPSNFKFADVSPFQRALRCVGKKVLKFTSIRDLREKFKDKANASNSKPAKVEILNARQFEAFRNAHSPAYRGDNTV